MGHKYIPKYFGQMNKKKLIVVGIIAVIIVLILLLLVGVAVFVVIKAVSGQATGSGIGKSVSDQVLALLNTAISPVQELWNQIITNPLQFFMGGAN